MPQVDTGQAVQIGIQGGAIAAGAGLALAGSLAAIPIVGLIAAPVALIASLIFNSANGQQKVASTSVVDQVEPLLKANLAAYLAGPRTAATQAAAVNYFDQVFAAVTGSQGCGNQSLGDAGKKCIKDRSRGGQWDWFAYYRDPIASDAIANGTSPASPLYTAAQSIATANPTASAAAIAAAVRAANPTASAESVAAAVAQAQTDSATTTINPLYIAAGVVAAVLLLK